MKLLRFAGELLAATNEGRIPWKESDGFEDEFVATANGYTISIAYAHDGNTGTGFHTLSVLSGGRPVGRIVAESHEDGYPLLMKLFMAAQAEANGIDEVLDDVSAAFKL